MKRQNIFVAISAVLLSVCITTQTQAYQPCFSAEKNRNSGEAQYKLYTDCYAAAKSTIDPSKLPALLPYQPKPKLTPLHEPPAK